MIKWVEGYEGKIAVSDSCKLYRIKNGKPIEVSQINHNQGYVYCTLTKKDGQTKNHLVHRIIATAFIQNPDNKKYVNHKDGNKKNNSIDNLEWATAKENTDHSYANGTNTHKARIGQLCVKTEMLIAEYESLKEAQIAMGKPGRKNICRSLIMLGDRTAYGYKWCYLNEGASETTGKV